MVQTHLVVDFEVAGFVSEEQKRWRRQDAVKRRENGFGSWAGGLGKFGVVFNSSGAEEECVSAVTVVKEEEFVFFFEEFVVLSSHPEEFVVLSSHPAPRNFLRWGLVETPAGILWQAN